MIELGTMTASCTVRAVPLPSEYIPIEIVGLDANHNGVIDSGDEAMFLATLGSTLGDATYDRQFDINFDGRIDSVDEYSFNQSRGLALEMIRNSVKTGLIEHLVWPDGWDAYLVALDKDTVNEFTGRGTTIPGWISVQLHPYGSGYVCGHFARDTAVASYKALGYGCLLHTFGGSTNVGHFYNLFWTGGDWHDLNNWWILEPQTGRLIGRATDELPTDYWSVFIFFYDEKRVSFTGHVSLYSHILRVDYANGTVDFGSGESSVSPAGTEEPVPDVFNTSLGVA